MQAFFRKEDIETKEEELEDVKHKKRNKKKSFILKDIDTSKIDKKYGIGINAKLKEENFRETLIPENVTFIDKLTPVQKQNFFIPFIDESRKHCVTMIDSISKKEIQASYCYWCRNGFSSIPIGCPIRFVNNKVVLKHTSEITNENYYIVHQVSNTTDINKKLNNSKIIYNNYYETDGCFCSFNCCLSFIYDNIHNSMYSNSKYLLMKMYSEIFETDKLLKFHPAPSWRLLREYGGFMTINEFRDSLTNYIYIDQNHSLSKLPNVMPIGHVFEEHIIF